MTNLVNSDDEDESKALHKSTPALQIVPLIAQKIIDPVAATPETTTAKPVGSGLNNRAIFMQVSLLLLQILIKLQK